MEGQWEERSPQRVGRKADQPHAIGWQSQELKQHRERSDGRRNAKALPTSKGGGSGGCAPRARGRWLRGCARSSKRRHLLMSARSFMVAEKPL